MTSDFKNSLSVGSFGETLYFQAHQGKLERLDGLKGDFRVMGTGDLIELKTDTYPMAKTQNFFMERYSDIDRQSPGGPWQALKNNCKLFTYFYVQDLTLFTFDTRELVEYLNQAAPTLMAINIPNKTWITQGFLVNRDLVKHLYKESKLKISIEGEEEK